MEKPKRSRSKTADFTESGKLPEKVISGPLTQTEIKNAEYETAYPSLELAYPVALAAYETAQKRMDAVEKRLQEVMAFAITITFAVIGYFAGKNYDLGSYFFIAAMISCLIGLAIAFYARLGGYLILLSPTKIFKESIVDPPAEYQFNAIYFSGQHWDINLKLINRKGKLTNISVLFFLIELVLLSIWVLRVARS